MLVEWQTAVMMSGMGMRMRDMVHLDGWGVGCHVDGQCFWQRKGVHGLVLLVVVVAQVTGMAVVVWIVRGHVGAGHLLRN